MASIEQWLLSALAAIYSAMGWPGVIGLMALESACIPIPSELIMPLAGWMLIGANGLPATYTLLAGLYGALGCTIGSVIAYGVGIWGGRPLLLRYGRYLLISRHDLEIADHWFARYGSLSIFVSRLLPVVRTFISLPAGVSRMNLVRFLIYTFIGSFIWCAGLAYGGYLLGEHWQSIREWMRPLDPLFIALAVALVVFYVYRHVRQGRQANNGGPGDMPKDGES